MLDKITIEKFKNINRAEIELADINVFVGGNNSGKTCLLQGIHFGINLAQSRRIAGAEQFPPDQLRYCPTEEFLNLRHGARLTEGLAVSFGYHGARNGVNSAASVRLMRGRNGVVKAQTSGGAVWDEISDPKGFFSIYVPGLAGVSIKEEYRSELVVTGGIARGDANLYLRNVLLRIARDEEKLKRFHLYLDSVFSGVKVRTSFDEANDLSIKTEISVPGKRSLPLDMVGTGLLQAIQLIAYVTAYSPKLLLLDEPDAHLHPSNQRLLCDVLRIIVSKTDTKILLATHSRHVLDALSDAVEAKLFWVKAGEAEAQESWSDIAVLMDLGALDKGERLLTGNYKYLIWTEDSETKYFEKFVQSNGLADGEYFLFSYQASSKVDAAKLMVAFMERVRPGVITIVHRDRDFMIDDEIERLTKKYELGKTPTMRLFITSKSDIESYFSTPEHLSKVTDRPEADFEAMIGLVIQENANEFVIKFRDKREDVKRDLYKGDPDKAPSATDMLPGGMVPFDKALGKLLLKKLGPCLQEQGINGGVVCATSTALEDDVFKALLVD